MSRLRFGVAVAITLAASGPVFSQSVVLQSGGFARTLAAPETTSARGRRDRRDARDLITRTRLSLGEPIEGSLATDATAVQPLGSRPRFTSSGAVVVLPGFNSGRTEGQAGTRAGGGSSGSAPRVTTSTSVANAGNAPAPVQSSGAGRNVPGDQAQVAAPMVINSQNGPSAASGRQAGRGPVAAGINGVVARPLPAVLEAPGISAAVSNGDRGRADVRGIGVPLGQALSGNSNPSLLAANATGSLNQAGRGQASNNDLSARTVGIAGPAVSGVVSRPQGALGVVGAVSNAAGLERR